MTGPRAPAEQADWFEVLSARWLPHASDPRLAENVSYEADERGVYRFTCSVGVVSGVELVYAAPPRRSRIAVAGCFLDELEVRSVDGWAARFPPDLHEARRTKAGRLKIRTNALSAVALLAGG